MPTAPSLRDLRAFLEVAQTRNVSRAAERLGVTQPSLSICMRRLERVLGAPLLVRGKQGVSLTAAGVRLCGHAQSLCEHWERTRDRVLAARHEVAGGYALSCHTAVGGYALGFLPALLRKHPHLHIHLMHDLSRRILEATLSRRCDMGLVINAQRHPDLVMRRLCRDEVTLFVSRTSAVVPDVLVCGPSLQQTQEILRSLRRRPRASFRRTIESSSLEVIAQLTAMGAGTGILSRNVSASYGLQAVPHAPVHHDELFFIYRMENKGLPAIRAVGRALIAAYASALV